MTMLPNQSPTTSGRSPVDIDMTRRLFWENVVRDMLTGLSVELGRARAEQMKANAGQADPQAVPMYDGRVAVITRLGARIPIADVQPMLACSVAGNPSQRSISADVQSTIFQIRTPAGEIFTLPLAEIATVHVLSPEVMAQLESANARNTGEGEGEARPFGYRAFTELARSAEAEALADAQAQAD